jgi:uncharacterized protein (TIGR03437 family)
MGLQSECRFNTMVNSSVYFKMRFLLLAPVLLAAPLAWGQSVITTIAGGDITYPTGSFSATSFSFGQLGGVAVSPSGAVYFASQTRSLIIRFDPQQGSVVVVAGIGVAGYSGDGGPASQAAINGPQQLAFDRLGNLYFADHNNGSIRRIDTQGVITTVTTGLGGPNGVAVAADGTIYASDTTRIYRIASNGVASAIAGGPQPGFSGDNGPAAQALLNLPYTLTFDLAGNLLVTDKQNYRIRRISSNGIISTIAGNGEFGNPVDGQSAITSPLTFLNGVAVDPLGNVLFPVSSALFKVDTQGILTRISANFGASSASFFLTQAGPLRNANVAPMQLAFDAAGNLYFTDFVAKCLYRSSPSGTVQVVAGYSPNFGIGDGRPALSASLSGPTGLALLKNGSLLIGDQQNQRIRQISPSGTITTVIGTGSPGLPQAGSALSIPLLLPGAVAGDAAGNLYLTQGGAVFHIDPSGTASILDTSSLKSEWGIAVDLQGNLLVADNAANRIVRFSPNGASSVLAGNGQAGFSGDGGPAVSAMLNTPRDLAVGSDGSVYITDTGNGRVRKVTPDGIITSINAAPPNNGGDGLTGIAVDRQGNVYVTANYVSRVQKITPDGRTAVIAGTGAAGFSGDGGPATSAQFNQPWGVAVDDSGNIYIADSNNNRIRKILAAPPSFSISASQVSLSADTNGQPVPTTVNVTGTIQGLSYSVAFSTATGGNWLGVGSPQGTAPGAVTITADPSNLDPGTYRGTVTLTSASASPSSLTITVTFQVGSAQPTKLTLDTRSLAFAFTTGSAQDSKQLNVSNAGSSVTFAVAASTVSGGSWLHVSPSTGTSSVASPGNITVTADPGSLPPGTYNGSVTITSAAAGGQFAIPVTMAISAVQRKILLSQTGLTFVSVAQGGPVLPQTFGILNAGSGSMTWTAQATTLSGSGWLGLSATTGSVTVPLLDVSFVDVIINAQSLAPGDYFGSIQVNAPGAADSPQTITVVLNVLPPGSNPGPEVRPTGLIFTGLAGRTDPGSQSVNVSNLSGRTQLSYGSSPTYVNGSNWLRYLPANATLDTVTPTRIVVQPDYSTLTPGIYRGAITLALTDGSIRTVGVLSVVAGSAATAGSSLVRPLTGGSCAPTQLLMVLTSSQQVLTASFGQPLSMQMQVVDDCGTPVTPQRGGAAVSATFSNNDPAVGFVHTENGKWSATWQPRNGSAGSTVRVLVTAFLAGSNGKVLGNQVYLTVSLTNGARVPSPQAVLNAASFLDTGVLTPGSLISVFGSGLANTQATGGSPLPTDLAGTQVTLGGQPLPLLYASDGQVNAQVPFSLAVNTQLQLRVKQGTSLSVPSSLTVAPAQPAVFTMDQSGHGQGVIVNVQNAIVDGNAPAGRGDTIVIYCTGLGAVDPEIAAGSPASSSPLSQTTSPVTVTIGGQTAQVLFAGLTPGFAGLYQVNAVVPGGVISGNAVPVVLQIAGQASPAVTMSVK